MCVTPSLSLSLSLALLVPQSFAKRAERFGSNSSEEAKKIARAQRYIHTQFLSFSITSCVQVW